MALKKECDGCGAQAKVKSEPIAVGNAGVPIMPQGSGPDRWGIAGIFRTSEPPGPRYDLCPSCYGTVELALLTALAGLKAN